MSVKRVKIGTGITAMDGVRYDMRDANDVRAFKDSMHARAANFNRVENGFERVIENDERWAKAVIEGKGETLPGVEDLARQMLRYITIARADIRNGNAADAARWALKIGYLSAQVDIKLEWEKPALSGKRLSETNADKGRRGAKARWEGEARDELAGIVTKLAMRCDELDYEDPIALWPRLYAEMDDAHLNPKESGGDKYIFGDNEEITYEAFRKRIQRARTTK